MHACSKALNLAKARQRVLWARAALAKPARAQRAMGSSLRVHWMSGYKPTGVRCSEGVGGIWVRG